MPSGMPLGTGGWRRLSPLCHAGQAPAAEAVQIVAFDGIAEAMP
jgi:hypothetical protein